MIHYPDLVILIPNSITVRLPLRRERGIHSQLGLPPAAGEPQSQRAQQQELEAAGEKVPARRLDGAARAPSGHGPPLQGIKYI